MTDLTDEDREAIGCLRADYILHGGNQHEAAYCAGLTAGRARAIEECAKVCEDIGKEIVCPEECAAAIRALK